MKFETERLIIREYEYTDLEEIHSWMSDDEIMTYMPAMKKHSIEETFIHLADCFCEAASRYRMKYYFAVTLKTGEFIGTCGITLETRNDYGGIASLGWALKKSVWGNGYAAECGRAMISYCFETLKLHKVIARCDAQNINSERVMQKCGMTKEATLIKEKFSAGEWIDQLIYYIIKK